MRHVSPRRFVRATLLGATIFGACLVGLQTPASAQSAADIINALKPKGTIGSGTRGIRPAAAAPAAADTTPAPSYAPAPVSAPVAAAPVAPAPVSHPVAVAAPPRAPAPAPAAAAAPSVNLEVKFATNSADLTPAAREALDRLGTALSSADLAGFRFRIEGHTDTVGSPDANRALSARRAAAVVDYLANVYHVDRSRLEAIGMGSDHPAVATGPQVDEPRNRRVHVVNLGA